MLQPESAEGKHGLTAIRISVVSWSCLSKWQDVPFSVLSPMPNLWIIAT
jgi:hypothetical protein